ncbi:MAG TPA: helix-turn-helix transcriptional regulator [Fibrobacteria bacterium]|nr:helix-turn-helix transcriptional regulator [Fibrobacteria bacterium]
MGTNTRGTGRATGMLDQSDSGAAEADSEGRGLGIRIKCFRELAGLSQADLGEKLGVSYQQIQKYERGANRVSVDTLVRMGRVLGQPVVAFLDPVEPPFRSVAVAEARPEYATLSRDERDLVKAWRDIGDDKVRAACLAMIKSAGKKGKG